MRYDQEEFITAEWMEEMFKMIFGLSNFFCGTGV
jgi:hypothetical protein